MLTNEPTSLVSDLIDTLAEAIPVDMPARQVAIEFEHDDLVSAPVIDPNGYLLGRITIDDIVDVIREEGENANDIGHRGQYHTTCQRGIN